MALTPNLLMAAEGLLADNALELVPVSTATYTSQSVVVSCLQATDTVTASVLISQPQISAFRSYITDNIPYLSNAVFYSDVLTRHRINLFPDNQTFVQYALIAMAQVDTANKYVNSAVNGATLAAQTFTTQDALITGNISAVSTNPQAWGSELINSGTLFDFAKLDNIGTPQAIVESLINTNMIGLIGDELHTQGIEVSDLTKVIADDPTKVLTPVAQKRCYEAFKLVTGDKLDDILEVMQFTTPGITSLAELLDLRKVFPTSFDTITVPNSGTLAAIFTPNGGLAAFVAAVTPPLASVIPAIIAKANFVFTCSLKQITGILDSTPQAIGIAASSIEDNTGLSHTGNLTQALPAATSASIVASMGGGTGPNSTFYYSDLIGAPAGIPYNDIIETLNTHITAIQSDGGYDRIIDVFSTITGLLNNNYDVDDTILFWIQLTNPYKVLVPFSVTTISPGSNYYIYEPGTTNFTLIGAPNNNVGTFFTATATVPTGTGRVTNDGYYASQSKTTPMNDLQAGLAYHVSEYTVAYSTEHNEMLTVFERFGGVIEGIKQLWYANVRFNTTYVPGYETVETVIEPGASVSPSVNGLPPQKSSTLAFTENLHTYSRRTDIEDIAGILEAMATDTQGGNAIIAAMREGRNKDRLGAAGVTGNNDISDQPQ